MTLIEDLQQFVASMEPDEHGGFEVPGTNYGYHPEPLDVDFNRDIITPEMDPDGVGYLLIRIDDFWQTACLPLKYVDLPLEDIVKTVWPNITDYKLRPDSRSSEQDEYYAEEARKIVAWNVACDRNQDVPYMDPQFEGIQIQGDKYLVPLTLEDGKVFRYEVISYSEVIAAQVILEAEKSRYGLFSDDED